MRDALVYVPYKFFCFCRDSALRCPFIEGVRRRRLFIYKIILLLFFLVCISTTSPLFAIYAYLESSIVKEGGLVKIRIGNKKKLKAADVMFLGKKYPAFLQGYDKKEYEYVYTAMLPVPLDTTGKKGVVIHYMLENGTDHYQKEFVYVKKLKTEVQKIDTAGQMSAEILAALRKENKIIYKYQDKITPVKYKFPFIRPFELDPENRIRETGGFGKSRIYDNGSKWRHKGIDIAAPEGHPVKAVNNGTVVVSAYGKGHGHMVVIDHGGGIFSIYFHLQKRYVKRKQEVKKGDVIAAVGSTGISTGPHLHWQMNVFKVPINPKELLTGF